MSIGSAPCCILSHREFREVGSRMFGSDAMQLASNHASCFVIPSRSAPWEASRPGTTASVTPALSLTAHPSGTSTTRQNSEGLLLDISKSKCSGPNISFRDWCKPSAARSLAVRPLELVILYSAPVAHEADNERQGTGCAGQGPSAAYTSGHRRAIES